MTDVTSRTAPLSSQYVPSGKGRGASWRKPVDRLHRRRRIEKWTVRQGTLGDVDQHSQTVRHVLIEGALKANLDGA
jgi:hypothetical protein